MEYYQNNFVHISYAKACSDFAGHQKFNYWGSVPMMQANNEWYEVGGVKLLPQGTSKQ